MHFDGIGFLEVITDVKIYRPLNFYYIFFFDCPDIFNVIYQDTFFHVFTGDSLGAGNSSSVMQASSIDPSQFFDDEDDDDDDDDGDRTSECSSSEGSSIGDYQHGYAEYTAEQLTELCTNRPSKGEINVCSVKDNELEIDSANKQALLGSLNTEVGPDGSMKIVQKLKAESNVGKEKYVKESKFKCGYCSFSAELRVKVKMHCSKKHANKVLNVIDPSIKPEPTVGQDNLDLDVSDWKGTKFEQDLRKAGVSKLNLASLFPNSKRFQKSDVVMEEIPEKSNEEQETTEFKKPLEPISKVKVNDKKLEQVEVKDKVVVKHKIDNSVKSDDDLNRAVEPAADPKTEKYSSSTDIQISDVRSLKQCEDKSSMNNTPESSSPKTVLADKDNKQENKTESKLDKVMTAFPNCTEVILEDEATDGNVQGSGKECLSTEVDTKEIYEDSDFMKSKDTSINCNNSTQNEVIEHQTNETAPENREKTKMEECSETDKMEHACMQFGASFENKNSNPGYSKTESTSLVNGHEFAIDGTIKENCETVNNVEDFRDVESETVNTDKNSKSSVFKLDGTCDGPVGKKVSQESTNKNTRKTSPVIDLPSSKGTTCAMNDICEET